MLSLLRHASPVVLAVSLLGLLILYFVVGAIVNQRKLRDFRGPPLAGYSRFWLFWQSIHANIANAEADALAKYGCPARLGPDLLVIDDPDMIRHFNSPGSGWRRSKWYDAMRFDPRLDTVFSTRDEKLHQDLKAKEAGGYNGRDGDKLEADLDLRVADLISLIRNSYAGKVLDMASIARYFTLDVLSTIAFGRPFGFMAANDDLWGYAQANNHFYGTLELVSHHKLFHWLLNTALMQYLFAPKPTDKTGLGPALAFSQKAVAERFGPDPKVRRDMLGHFVDKGLSQLRCETEAFLQIIAGSDSTTTVLRCTMFLLAGNSPAYTKLRAEIDSFASSQNPSPSPGGSAGGSASGVIKYADAQKLPYLSAVLWEGLRMYPPLFGLKSKLAPPGGDTVNGVYFPAGTEVCICDKSMCRRVEIFGPDAHLFRPERWLDADPASRKLMLRTTEAVFGTGRFMCLGKHIAMMELHKGFYEMIRNFDWVLENPMRGIDQISHGVHNHSNMNMVPRTRVAATS